MIAVSKSDRLEKDLRVGWIFTGGIVTTGGIAFLIHTAWAKVGCFQEGGERKFTENHLMTTRLSSALAGQEPVESLPKA